MHHNQVERPKTGKVIAKNYIFPMKWRPSWILPFSGMGTTDFAIFSLFFFFKNGVNTHYVIKLGADEHILNMSPFVAYSYL